MVPQRGAPTRKGVGLRNVMEVNREPRVSVVIPTFNRARFLPDAIRSVLRQTHRDIELIVVDDGSTDHTREVLAGFDDARLCLVFIERSRSPARARNVGVARATGQFVAFLDSDDVWLPEKLERQLAALLASPGSRWSYTLFDHIDEHGAFMAPLRGGDWAARSGWIIESMVSEEVLVMVQSVLAETSLVREVGGFDETPALREDLDLCFRLAVRSEACAVAENLLRVRHHTQRTTYAMPEVREWRVRALRKLEASASDPRLRRLCRQQCGKALIDLAEVYDCMGAQRGAFGALARASRYVPYDPRLWMTLTKTVMRPWVGGRVLDAYRRARERRALRIGA